MYGQEDFEEMTGEWEMAWVHSSVEGYALESGLDDHQRLGDDKNTSEGREMARIRARKPGTEESRTRYIQTRRLLRDRLQKRGDPLVARGQTRDTEYLRWFSLLFQRGSSISSCHYLVLSLASRLW